jgi:uncharacterized membrane protein YbhN (UPF0104 family)
VRLLPPALAIVLLAVIYARVDAGRVLDALRGVDGAWLALAFALFVPQIAVTALRWRRLVDGVASLGRWEACRHVLASSTLNVVTPSKLGDLAKAWFVARSADVPLGRAVGFALAEKLVDLWALCTILLAANLVRGIPADPLVVPAVVLAAGVFAAVIVGLLAPVPAGLAPRLPRRLASLVTTWEDARRLALAGASRRCGIAAVSLGLWVLHVAQIHAFFASVGGAPAALKVYALVPVAILAGLLPVTQGGFGTRDAALLHLFAGDAPPAVLAAVGLLTGTRYVVPALIGLPFLPLMLRARAALGRGAAAAAATGRPRDI